MPLLDQREYEVMCDLAKERGYKVVQLEVGDYESEPNIHDKVIRIERKSDDFLTSLFSGNLFVQLKKMNNEETTAQSFLVVDKSLGQIIREGMIRPEPIQPNIIYGAVASLCIRGFPPLFLENHYHTFEIIDLIFQKHVDGKTRDVHEKTEIGGHDLLLFPGVDVVLGKRLLLKFQSFKRIANATKEELLEIDGIGPIMAERIHHIINKEHFT